MVCLAQRIELAPNVTQKIYFTKACGTARYAYNWALDQWDAHYKAGEKTGAYKICKEFNAWKAFNAPWVCKISHSVTKYAIKNVEDAYHRFFKKLSQLPKRKKKGKNDSFRVDNGCGVYIDSNSIFIPKLGLVKLKETPRWINNRVTEAVVSRECDKWFVSVTFDLGDDYNRKPAEIVRPVIGIDLGLKTAIVCSNGQTFDAPKPLKNNLRRLNIRQRRSSRKVKGSNNSNKTNIRVAKVHRKIKNIRKDWTHKVTCKLARENQTIKLEDLNVSGMLKNHKLSRAIADIGFFNIRHQLAYKTKLYCGHVKFIYRWAPSSQTCSNCGVRREVNLALKDRTLDCVSCGMVKDRDLNAAINIENFVVPEVIGELTPVSRRKSRHDRKLQKDVSSSVLVSAGTEADQKSVESVPRHLIG